MTNLARLAAALIAAGLSACSDAPSPAAPPADAGSDASDAALDLPTSSRLTVYRDGDGAGQITSLPAGIACPSQCSSAFDVGADVALSVEPGPDTRFEGWSGACTGLAPCRISMTVGREVTATWRRFALGHAWARGEGSAGGERADDVAVDPQGPGDLYVVGRYDAPGLTLGSTALQGAAAGEAGNVLVAGFTAAGEPRWALGFDAATACPAPRVTVGAGSEIVVVGQASATSDLTGGFGAATHGGGPFLAAYDRATGAASWQRVFPVGCFTDVAPGPDASLAVVGFADAASAAFGGPALPTRAGATSLVVASFAGDGSPGWSRAFATAPFDFAQGRAVAVDAAGAILFAGFLQNTGAVDLGGGPLPTGSSVVVAKLDASGAHVWSTTYGDVRHDVSALTLASDGDLLLTGVETRGAVEVLWVARLDPSGQPRWRGEVDLAERQGAAGIVATPDDAVLVVGSSYVPTDPLRQLTVARFSGAGVLEYQQPLGGPDEEQAFAAALSASGGLVVVGSFASAELPVPGGEPLVNAGAPGTEDLLMVELTP